MKSKILALTIGVLLSAPLCYAESDDREQQKKQTQQQLQQLQQKIQSVKQLLDQTRKKATNAEKELRKTELEINQSAITLRSTAKKIDNSENELSKLRQQESELQNQKKKQLEALESQIRSAYMTGRQEYLKLLLSQENPAILGRVMTMYRYLNKARGEEIDKLQQTIDRLVKVQASIITQLDVLKKLYAEQKQQNQQLLALKQQRKNVVRQLLNEAKSEDSRLAGLLADEKQLKDVIEELSRVVMQILPPQELKGLGNLKGKLLWPTQGKVSASFGSRRNKRGSLWHGVVLSAPEGAEVNAIHHGRVVFSDWLRGFGLLTIIDHGDQYMSLYAFNQSLLKSVGENVEAGEPIATVGQSGGQDEPGVYFELRYKSKPVDPKRWISR